MTLYTSLDGLVSFKAAAIVGRDNAEAQLCAFRAANWTNPLADGSIWSAREGRYIEKWRGGQVFGPRDTRHPLVRIYDRAIRSGRPVIIGDATTRHLFNQERAA